MRPMKQPPTMIGAFVDCAGMVLALGGSSFINSSGRAAAQKQSAYMDQGFYTFSVDFPLEMFMEHLRVFHPDELPHLLSQPLLYPAGLGFESPPPVPLDI